MRASELRNLSGKELATRLSDAKQEAFNLRFQQASGQLEDTNRLKILRRDIARILTILRERELAGQENG
jgi:large subunit ribosomal protein L29